MLSTVDNPFNPFSQFDDWEAFDERHGYNCCNYLARFAFTSDALSDQENDKIIEDAIDEIVKTNPLGVYIKVKNTDGKVANS
jgi:hypothetical protein